MLSNGTMTVAVEVESREAAGDGEDNGDGDKSSFGDDVPEARRSSCDKRAHARSEFEQLSLKCGDDCKELLKLLEGVMRRSGKNRPWQTAKAAVRSLLSQKKIAELEANIGRTRDIMYLHLQSLISSEVTDLKVSMKKISTNSRSLSMQQSDRLEAIDQGIRSLKLSLQDQQADSEEPRRVPSTTHIERLTTNMKTTMTEKADALAEQYIVSSLHYSSRTTRYQDIPAASRDTFEWIYESTFVDWLQNGEGVFWITGKAGSGKSTLMKYIAHHETTRRCLDKWADPKQAIIASHYFYAPGSPMQKSLQGLLQALLLDLFRQCPSIIPSVVPEQWRKASSESTPEQWQRQTPGQNHEAWTIQELSEALVRVGYLDDSPVRFCLFIDGLDEYSGDYLDLCDMLGRLLQSQSLKFCVSSRPSKEFESAFGSDPDKTLVIHEKTKQDIMISVQIDWNIRQNGGSGQEKTNVRDFLLTDEMTSYISAKLKSEFEASLAITRAFAAWLKTCPFKLGVESGEGQKVKSLLEAMLVYADQASERHVMETAVILDDLESAIVALSKKPRWLDGQMRQDPLRVFRTMRDVEGFHFALKQHIFQNFLEHGADPNDNGFEHLGGRLSAFSMFVLAALNRMAPAWDKQSSQLYDRTLRDFLEAGASPRDYINVEPLLLRLRACSALQDDMSLCDDIERAQTIKAQLARQQDKAVDAGRAESAASIASVLGMISRFEEGADCAHVKRKAPSEHDMQAGEISKRARLSDSLICDPHVFTNAKE
ncbi:hypothetical protein LA080_014643 [Diaporthe eres]|nr:hypothetical protein LA080_014643 [Diaporthe eres]